MKLGLAGAGRIGALHCATLAGHPRVEAVLVADLDAGRATRLARAHGAHAAGSVDELFESGLDGLVVTAATNVHADLVLRGVAMGVPVFCEKPIAPDLDDTVRVVAEVERRGGVVRIGFQRRFDRGYAAARERLRSGGLGWLHTLRATTLDPKPPPAEYVPGSGGIFRDCGVHDFDAIRWVTGREVVEVYATGANRGDTFIAAAGDVDTGATVLRLDDDTLGFVSNTRYNGAGYDVRLELLGERGSLVVGLDGKVPLRSAEPGVTWPPGPPYDDFEDRFADAYRAELAAFVDLVTGRADEASEACTAREALEAFYVAEACEVSRREHRPVRVEDVRR